MLHHKHPVSQCTRCCTTNTLYHSAPDAAPQTRCITVHPMLHHKLPVSQHTRCCTTNTLYHSAFVDFLYIKFFHFPKRSDRLWGPPSPLIYGHREPFPGINRPVREDDQTSPSSAELGMTGSEPPLPLLVFVGWPGTGSSRKRQNEGNLVQNGIIACSCVVPL